MIAVFRHVEVEDLGMWEDVLKEEKKEFRYFEVSKEEFPDNIDDYTHLVILGGPQSVNELEKYSFIKRELEILERFIEKDKPTLGVCLGAQMIAKLLGSRVYKGVREIGWVDIALTRPALVDYLFAHFPKTLKVFQWHEETFDLPSRCVRLASSKFVPNQAFRYGTNVYAVQFHLEVTPSMVARWKEYYRDYLSTIDASIPSFFPEGSYFPVSWEFFKRFLQLPRKEA